MTIIPLNISTSNSIHLITIITYYNKLFRRTFLAANTSSSLQTPLAAYAHPADGPLLHEE
jgi:hypothetical protein